MGRRGGYIEYQMMMPMTKMVKYLIIICSVIWFFGNVLAEQYVFHEPKLTMWFGLVPIAILKDYFVWQPFTYLFIHTPGPMHILFNMLVLWWLGSELERLWGSRFFLLYYFVSGVGAAVLYMIVVFIYGFTAGRTEPLMIPVVGASAAIFGLLVAYGLIYGERIIYFMLFIPMKAKIFVLIMAGVEIVMVLNNGVASGSVANLAHVGGLISGFVFLKIWPYINGSRGGRSGGSRVKKRAGNLRLVVNNENFDSSEGPKYWN